MFTQQHLSYTMSVRLFVEETTETRPLLSHTTNIYFVN